MTQFIAAMQRRRREEITEAQGLLSECPNFLEAEEALLNKLIASLRREIARLDQMASRFATQVREREAKDAGVPKRTLH
jgi:hypothetical protein